MAQDLKDFGPSLKLLSRHRRDDDDFFDDDDFGEHIQSAVRITWTVIVGIIVGVILLIIFITVLICFCVCRRKRAYTGRTLYSPTQTNTTTTTYTTQSGPATAYPAQSVYHPPGGYPQPAQGGYHPVNYPAPQSRYPPQLPPGQAPPPYPGPPQTGYQAQPYPPQVGPPQYKMDSPNYPPQGVDHANLQKASAPPPEY